MGSLVRVVDSSTIEIRVHDPRIHGKFLGPVPPGGRTELVRVQGVTDATGAGRLETVDTADALERLLRDKRLFCAVRRLESDGRAVAHVIAVSYITGQSGPVPN